MSENTSRPNDEDMDKFVSSIRSDDFTRQLPRKFSLGQRVRFAPGLPMSLFEEGATSGVVSLGSVMDNEAELADVVVERMFGVIVGFGENNWISQEIKATEDTGEYLVGERVVQPSYVVSADGERYIVAESEMEAAGDGEWGREEI